MKGMYSGSLLPSQVVDSPVVRLHDHRVNSPGHHLPILVCVSLQNFRPMTSIDITMFPFVDRLTADSLKGPVTRIPTSLLTSGMVEVGTSLDEDRETQKAPQGAHYAAALDTPFERCLPLEAALD